MKWTKKIFALLIIMLFMLTVQAQTIQNISYPLGFSKKYRSDNSFSMAGNGTSVILNGDGKTGASITIQASAPVTLNGGFTVQRGATLYVLAGEAQKTVPVVVTANNIKNNLALYPNPALNRVSISLPPWNSSIKKELVVTDFSGRQVLQQIMQPGTTGLDVSQWPRGNFLFTVRASGGTQQTGRLVLQ